MSRQSFKLDLVTHIFIQLVNRVLRLILICRSTSKNLGRVNTGNYLCELNVSDIVILIVRAGAGELLILGYPRSNKQITRNCFAEKVGIIKGGFVEVEIESHVSLPKSSIDCLKLILPKSA